MVPQLSEDVHELRDVERLLHVRFDLQRSAGRFVGLARLSRHDDDGDGREQLCPTNQFEDFSN